MSKEVEAQKIVDSIHAELESFGLFRGVSSVAQAELCDVLLGIVSPATANKAEVEPLTATHGPIHLTNRKTAEIAKTDYNIIGYVLRREDGDAVCISAESAVRWLPEAHYWRLMHEQDGSLFATPPATTGASTVPHWYDSPQSALGGKTAREGYAANPEYAHLQPVGASTVLTDERIEQVSHERDALATAIRDAAVKAGIARADAALTGPHLLMLADDMASVIAAQAGQVAPTEATRPLSDSNARFAIDAAIMFGREGVNRPPTDDHWLFEYWNIGQQLAQLGATSGWDNVTPIAAAGQVAVPEGRQALVNEALSAARELGDREYAHAHSLGKGGPGVKAKVLAAEERVVKAITALAAPAEAQQAPATDALDAARYRWLCEHGHERMPEAVLQVVDAAHYEGEQIPKNLIDQVIDKERAAQASTAGERSQEGGAA